MTLFLRPFLRILPLAGLLFLAACPQMTTGALSGAGFPLSATGEKTNSTTETSDKGAGTDEFAPPPAVAPLPPPPGGGDAGGLGGEGGGNPEYAARMMGPVDAPAAGTPVGESVRVARESGGVVSAPSITERIGSEKDNVRALGWPVSVRREWTDASDFFRKIAACRTTDRCELSEEVAKQVVVLNTRTMMNFPDMPADMGTKESEIADEVLVDQSGHYLFFVTKDYGVDDLGPPSAKVSSLQELEDLATDDRLKFVAEKDRTVFYDFHFFLDPSLYYRALP